MPARKATKEFLLTRSSYWVDRHVHMVTRMPEPEEVEKRVHVSNVAELVAEVEKLASEYCGTCEVYMKCLTGRPFAKCPRCVCCNKDRAVAPPWWENPAAWDNPAA